MSSTAVLVPAPSRGSMSPATIAPARRDARQMDFGQAASLRAVRAGVLRVMQGRLWVTRDATRRRATEDLVLAPGDALSLEAGDRVVLEPWSAPGAVFAWSEGRSGYAAADPAAVLSR